MSERDLENLWQARIGAVAASEMRRWRTLTLLLGLCYVGQVCFVFWLVSIPASTSLPISVVVSVCVVWLLLTIGLTIWWVQQRRALRVHASGEVSKQRRRVLVVPYRALTSIDRFDDWVTTQDSH